MVRRGGMARRGGVVRRGGVARAPSRGRPAALGEGQLLPGWPSRMASSYWDGAGGGGQVEPGPLTHPHPPPSNLGPGPGPDLAPGGAAAGRSLCPEACAAVMSTSGGTVGEVLGPEGSPASRWVGLWSCGGRMAAARPLCPCCGTVGQVLRQLAARRDPRVARVLARKGARQDGARHEPRGHVLHRVHAAVHVAVEKRDVQLLPAYVSRRQSVKRAARQKEQSRQAPERRSGLSPDRGPLFGPRVALSQRAGGPLERWVAARAAARWQVASGEVASGSQQSRPLATLTMLPRGTRGGRGRRGWP